jgi:hypothetical protein
VLLNSISSVEQGARPSLRFFSFGKFVVPGKRKMRSIFCVPGLAPSRSITPLMRASTSSICA